MKIDSVYQVYMHTYIFAQLAGSVEYTNCTSAEG